MKRTLLAASILAALATPATATTVNIATFLTGNPVANNTTVATLTFNQNGVNVDFSLTNQVGNMTGGLGDDAFISQLQFSYAGATPLTAASFSNFGGTQPLSASQFHINPNGKDAGYDFFLDLGLPTSNQDDRFFNGEVASWTISNVSVADFLTPVSGSGADSLAIVHIQQVGAGPGGSGSDKFIGTGVCTDCEPNPRAEVPEPGTVALMGLGLLGLGVITRRRK